MERTSHVIKGERANYKQFTKCSFNGFSRNYPPELRSILHPHEYDSIIQNINLNSIRTKKTSTLKVISVSGEILWIAIIGIPIVLGCLLADKIIYRRFYKKITNSIQTILFQLNSSELCISRGIEFTLRKSPRTSTGCEYSIIISYLRLSGSRAQTTFMNISAVPANRVNNSTTTNNIINNYHNTYQAPTSTTSSTATKTSNGKPVDLTNIPIDK
ncbi:hypothetical protein ACTA71_004134 [Dictyostelium dimigraforme]